ncbi:hypothetical protein Lupro_03425 [Lutibacter profundi]|uniref:Uncharacterized protein n=1 Tax=Lutibacter profundi TaxID=1622118 RepID=A0A0X8G8S4_9FLAO|nr:hypothetical protein [Lutibacter profundi]AMC12182.1 hypothetical protein Lupro_03425 [Lutibacter profundi]
MTTFKHILVAILIMLISGLITYYLKPNNPIIMVFLFLIVVFFIFNLIIRKSLSFKNYFTNQYNLFTTKVWHQKSYDIPKDLMFEKIIEVINSSNFKLVETNKEKLEILAISTITFKSWGENLYISFETNGNETIMKFCSTTLFQIYSWGKNEKNYDNLLNDIENSLIV